MPRTASDSLFQLIHSLSRSEKGYVKKYCSRHVLGDGNDYVRLFDAIEAQERPDETALKEALKGSTMLKRLPSVKNYLYQQILEAMRNYHAAKSPEREITENLLDADFLWEKALYDQAMKRVRRAKELAERYDEYAFWLKTISWEKNYRGVIRERPDLTDGVDPLGREQEHIIALLSRTIEYEHLGNLLQHYLIYRSNGDRSGDAWLTELPEHPLMSDPSLAISRPAKLNRLLILASWNAFVARDANEAMRHAKDAYEFLLTQPDLISARPDLELGLLQTYLQFCVDARRFDEYKGVADRLWDPKGLKPTKNIDVKRFYRAMSTELGYAAISKDLSRVLPMLPFLRDRYAALREEIPMQSRASCTFLAARICVEQDLVKDAGWWIMEALSGDADVRADLHVAARLLQLRLADDANDRDLMRSLSRSLVRFITRHKLRNARLDAVMSYYRRRSEVRTDRDVRRIRRETANRLASAGPPTSFDPVASAGLDGHFDPETTSPSPRSVEAALNY
jgi:hypothetical protein